MVLCQDSTGARADGARRLQRLDGFDRRLDVLYGRGICEAVWLLFYNAAPIDAASLDGDGIPGASDDSAVRREQLERDAGDAAARSVAAGFPAGDKLHDRHTRVLLPGAMSLCVCSRAPGGYRQCCAGVALFCSPFECFGGNSATDCVARAASDGAFDDLAAAQTASVLDDRIGGV